MTGGLNGEFASAVTRLFDDGHAKTVLNLGVPKSAICGRPPLVGVAAVEIDDDGSFQFIEYGDLALVVADGVRGAMGWSTVDELVVFRTDRPGRWGVRRGDVPLLGAGLNDALHDYAMTLGEPIRLYENPMSWLRAGGQGLVVLDWSFDPLKHFKGLHICCETPALEAQLRDRTCEAALSSFAIEAYRNAA